MDSWEESTRIGRKPIQLPIDRDPRTFGTETWSLTTVCGFRAACLPLRRERSRSGPADATLRGDRSARGSALLETMHFDRDPCIRLRPLRAVPSVFLRDGVRGRPTEPVAGGRARRFRSSLGALALLSLALSGCEHISALLDVFRTGPRELSDESAFEHLRVDRTAAPTTNIAAILRAADLETGGLGGAPTVIDDVEVAALLERTTYPRLTMREDAFTLVNFAEEGLELRSPRPGSGGNCAFDIELDALDDEYLIPHVDKIPVRDQGQRGTCAAFAGIGNIEYAALNPDPSAAETSNPELPTLDLSEQKFYWDSKPECQSAGSCPCNGCAGGSWYGVGMDVSARSVGLNIPLETDCPYNPRSGATDTQTPLLGSCASGALKVERVDGWCGVSALVDLLHAGYAVPYGSPLSGNWERADWLITKADLDAGATVHAGGHAYLFVGYRRLPDRPEEGGVCFIIKNSWGIGWGTHGYACVTLAWLRAVNFDGFIRSDLPVVLAVELRDDLAASERLPDNNEAAEDEARVDVDDDPLPVDDDLLPPDQPDDAEVNPVPLPNFRRVRLLGPGETYYVAEIAEEGSILQLRGPVRGIDGAARPLQIEKRGRYLFRGDDEIGEVGEDHVTLCTGRYRALCSLRYRSSDRQLYVQFRDDDLRVVTPEEVGPDRGEWLDLFGFSLFLPADIASPEFLANPKTFVRLGDRSPLRLSLRPNDGSPSRLGIRLSGVPVGRLDVGAPQESALCSGTEFGSSCLFVGGRQLRLIPQNARRPSAR